MKAVVKTLGVATALASVVLLSGCNTARGLGADIEELGRMMQGKPKGSQEVQVEPAAQNGSSGSVYVEPATAVETYPYQGGASYPAQPIQPAPASGNDPSLGEVVPAKTIKEM